MLLLKDFTPFCAEKSAKEKEINVLLYKIYNEATLFHFKKIMHRPGIEPGPPAWQASILPLNQRCFVEICLKFYFAILRSITAMKTVKKMILSNTILY